MTAEMITDGMIADYERDGVVCLRGVLSGDEINGIRDCVEMQLAEHGRSNTGYDYEDIAAQVWAEVPQIDTYKASRFNMQGVRDRVLADGGARPLQEEARPNHPKGKFFYDAAAWRRHRGLRSAALDSQLPEAIATLLRSERLHFWEDTTFVKEPGTRQKTAFHQDLGYFQISGEQCVIVWIPLDPVDVDNGTLKYVRGSHKWPQTFAPNVLFTHSHTTGASGELCPDIEADEDAYDIVQFKAEPGDVIVHHVRTVHGAAGNMSNRRRRAVSLRYCGDDVRYLERQGAVKQLYTSHQLKDGDRLDSVDYPIVYPRPWPGLRLADVYAQFGDVCDAT
ncbi:MAG: phytanoyl-CoA dioxygenase family protein [Pseudomonadota bacterium]